MAPSYKAQANNFALWGEWFDAHATMTEAEFDAMPEADKIFLLVDAYGPEEPTLADHVKEWLNCKEAEIDDDGNIWVSGPMTGHWLSVDKKIKFENWLEKQ